MVLSAECASHWLEPELEPREAEDLAIEHGLGVEALD